MVRLRRRVFSAAASSSSAPRAVAGVGAAALGEFADQERKERRPATESLETNCWSVAWLQRGGLRCGAGPRLLPFGVRGGGGGAASSFPPIRGRRRDRLCRWAPSTPGATETGLGGTSSATRAER